MHKTPGTASNTLLNLPSKVPVGFEQVEGTGKGSCQQRGENLQRHKSINVFGKFKEHQVSPRQLKRGQFPNKDGRVNLQEAFGCPVKASGLNLRDKAQALKDSKQRREGIRSVFQKGNSGGCTEGGTKPRVPGRRDRRVRKLL